MLPYTAEAFFAQLAQYNQDTWPAMPVAALLALLMLGLVLRPAPWSGRLIAAFLAAAWLWTGIAWHFYAFSPLNFAAPAYGVLFVIEGLLFAWSGLFDKTSGFRFRRDAAGWMGLVLAVAALILYPAVDSLTAGGWTGVRVIGLAPAPTAAFTLGLLLLAEGRVRWRLAVVPLLWTAAAGATGWILGMTQDVGLAAVGLVSFGVMIRKNKTSSDRTKANRSPEC